MHLYAINLHETDDEDGRRSMTLEGVACDFYLDHGRLTIAPTGDQERSRTKLDPVEESEGYDTVGLVRLGLLMRWGASAPWMPKGLPLVAIQADTTGTTLWVGVITEEEPTDAIVPVVERMDAALREKGAAATVALAAGEGVTITADGFTETAA